MNRPEHIVLGEEGEKLARLHLLNDNYIILERNYYFNNLEVDIIAEKDNEIVFVEVKTRRKHGLLGPQQAVDRDKEINLIEVSDHYMQSNELELNYRIDIITVIKNQSTFSLNHFENAGEYFLID